MSAIETLRAILVGGAAVAAVIAGLLGLWLTVVILVAAILVHGYTTLYLRRLRLGHLAPAPPPARPEAPG
jgi:hypothetical protein